MTIFNPFSLLPAVALAAGLSVAAGGTALAARGGPEQASISASAAPAVAADYIWNGRHYVYRWHGRYFNHRRWHKNVWVYY
jgi:hypothetical protein